MRGWVTQTRRLSVLRRRSVSATLWLGLELANDHAAAIVYSFFQMFQQRFPMRCVVPYDIVF
jgi:hypothetical protein